MAALRTLPYALSGQQFHCGTFNCISSSCTCILWPLYNNILSFSLCLSLSLSVSVCLSVCLLTSLSHTTSLSLSFPSLSLSLHLLSRLRHFCNNEACNTFFHAHIMSRINYVSNVWDGCNDVHIKKLQSVQKRAVKVLCAASPMLTGRGHISYGPLPLKVHLRYNKCILVHKVIRNKSPQYPRQLVHAGARIDHSSRNSILILPKTRIDIYKMSFAYSGSFCWNALPRSLKTACSVSIFKSKALQHFRTECNISFQS